MWIVLPFCWHELQPCLWAVQALDRSKDRERGSGTDGGADNRAEGERQRDSDVPPTSLQLAVGAAGLAALPIVIWSEWVLKSTGKQLSRHGSRQGMASLTPERSCAYDTCVRSSCQLAVREPCTALPCCCTTSLYLSHLLRAGCGLPPGPSGLLGAAEGISYLVVGGIVVWSLARKLGSGSGEWSGSNTLICCHVHSWPPWLRCPSVYARVVQGRQSRSLSAA